ncbi:MAG TPA: chromate resistance protein ChrB domain-containing protein [Polyangiaceae bacterium]|nr:chromate resistance protein ChrB domain-containing protein [Polyangiaceae bacterium]
MTSHPKRERWLLLVHQIPPKPSYFRAKVGRRLQKIGAVAIKNSVYVLPRNEQTQEDFQWATREIIAEGGDAALCTASLVEGLRDEQVEALFQAARQADYAQLAEDARAALAEAPARPDDQERAQIEASLVRLTGRMAEVATIDFFGAQGREAAESLISTLAKRARSDAAKRAAPEPSPKRAEYQRRTWVTRKNVHVDRIASAWLIKRFIDDKPTFKFVDAKGYEPKKSEVTFDMFEATFTHVGDRCTFEVLVDRFGLCESGLRAIAEIVHDIDVKDGKFARPEAPGVASLIAGIALLHREDLARIAMGSTMLDALLELHRRKR